jgi:hypothetical protein
MATINKDNHRIKLKELLVSIRKDHNVQMVIWRDRRSDLPHLTINWGNPSGNINAHLTVTRKDNEKEYLQVAQISETDLAKCFESFEPELINIGKALANNAHPVSPSWLRRRGYKIVFWDEDAEKHLLKTIIPRQKYGRKNKKWTYIPDERILNDLDRLPEVSEYYHHPRKLRDLTGRNYNKPVFAECMYGKKRGQMMILILISRPDRKSYWVSLNLEMLQELLKSGSDLVRAGLTTLLPPNALEKVNSGLRLVETGW